MNCDTYEFRKKTINLIKWLIVSIVFIAANSVIIILTLNDLEKKVDNLYYLQHVERYIDDDSYSKLLDILGDDCTSRDMWLYYIQHPNEFNVKSNCFIK